MLPQAPVRQETMSETTLAALTAELVNSQDQLLAMYELSEAMRQKLNIEDAVDELAHLAARTMKAEAAAVILIIPNRPTIISQYPEESIQHNMLEDWLRKIQSSQYYILQNQTPDFNSLLVLPMHLNGQIAGALAIANKLSGPMASPDRKLGQAIANQAGVHLENVLFVERSVSEARLQTELQLARDVQMQLLPQQPPEVPGLDISAFSKPAMHVGGDSYDFVVRDDRQLYFNVGDVSGKGMSAALLMTMMRTSLRNAWRFNNHISPATVIDRTNTSLYDDFTETGMFATLFVADYSAGEGALHYANAGHSPVIFRPKGGKARLLEADGVPVGVLTDSLVEDQSLVFGAGDLLVVCTDGLNEARNVDGELFGHERLLKLVDDLASHPAEFIVECLLRSVTEYTQGQPQEDDQTLIVIKGMI